MQLSEARVKKPATDMVEVTKVQGTIDALKELAKRQPVLISRYAFVQQIASEVQMVRDAGYSYAEIAAHIVETQGIAMSGSTLRQYHRRAQSMAGTDSQAEATVSKPRNVNKRNARRERSTDDATSGSRMPAVVEAKESDDKSSVRRQEQLPTVTAKGPLFDATSQRPVSALGEVQDMVIDEIEAVPDRTPS